MTFSSMIAPLQICSVQMIQFMLYRVLRRDKTKNNALLIVLSWIAICPLFLIFMFVMDTVFVVNITVFEALAFIIGCCCTVNCIKNAVDKSYEWLFHMKTHEVNGFRRMRTIT